VEKLDHNKASAKLILKNGGGEVKRIGRKLKELGGVISTRHHYFTLTGQGERAVNENLPKKCPDRGTSEGGRTSKNGLQKKYLATRQGPAGGRGGDPKRGAPTAKKKKGGG